MEGGNVTQSLCGMKKSQNSSWELGGLSQLIVVHCVVLSQLLQIASIVMLNVSTSCSSYCLHNAYSLSMSTPCHWRLISNRKQSTFVYTVFDETIITTTNQLQWPPSCQLLCMITHQTLDVGGQKINNTALITTSRYLGNSQCNWKSN